MKTENNNIDKLTGELLKKSLQKPISSDFDDELMNKILDAPLPVMIKDNRKQLKNGWRFLILACALLIASVAIITYLSTSDATQNLNQYWAAARLFILYGGMAFFVPLLFFQLDSLLKMMYQNRLHPKMNY